MNVDPIVFYQWKDPPAGESKNANCLFARSKKVARGEQMSNSWELDGWKCIERWWFA